MRPVGLSLRAARTFVSMALVLAVVGLAAYGLRAAGLWNAAAPEIVAHTPRIEEVREIAKLATLRVKVSDVIEGRNGGGQALVIVHGDADLAVDWNAIQIDRVNPADQTLRLTAPAPRLERARVDHTRTRVYEVRKTGLAAWNPFADPRAALLEDCMRAAQGAVERLASDPAFVRQAKTSAEALLTAYHARLGWKAQIVWRETPQETTQPTILGAAYRSKLNVAPDAE